MELETVVDDSGPATQDVCPICGTSSFYPEGGFYYCSLCNTQSQVSRLYVEDDFRPEYQQRVTRAAVLRGEKQRKEKVKESHRQLSSWEIWNVVLKNMADRLIEIGFPEVVRAKIFQLYVSFMMRRKVIFASTSNPDAKYRTVLREPKTNLYTLSGVKKPPTAKIRRRKQLVKKKVNNEIEPGNSTGVEDGFLSRQRQKAMSKRKAMEKEYLSKEKEVPDIDEREFENMIDEESRAKDQKKSTSGGDKPTRKRKPRKPPRSIKTMRGIRVPKVAIAYTHGPSARYEHFTLNSCLITVFVALRELGFPVVMTDILRLNNVGILQVDNVGKLIREIEEYKDIIVQHISHFFCSYQFTTMQNYASLIENFVNYIGIKKFRYPQMKEIVPKYIDEFVLPREFECLVNLINHMFSFDDYADDMANAMPNLNIYRALPEVIVLVQFVVVLKMLFGLDDRTEKFQSEFAKLVNKVVREEVTKRDWQMEEWTELFVIEEWFGYLQRRRELVKRELCCSSMYTPNKPPTITKLQDLMRNCSLEDDPDENEDTMTPHEKAAKSCKTMFEGILKDTLSKAGESEEIPRLKRYIPLPLPTESIVKQYVERYPLVADPAVKPELLAVDFVQKRLDFIWNPKKYKKLLQLHGYRVKIIHGDAVNNFPIELKEDVASSKVVLVFQPYKSFDEFVGRVRDDCSYSMKLILGLCEDIIPGVSADKTELRHSEPFLQKLVNAVGDMYIKRVLTELTPIMTRWDEPDSE